MENKKILFGISGSFCNHRFVLDEVRKLAEHNEIQIVLTRNAATLSTRFFNHIDFINECVAISKKPVIKSIVEAELIGPSNEYDIMVIAPMSATVASRLANGHNDCPLALAAKAMIRNNKNIVMGFASNDGLGCSGKNLFSLMNQKHLYFIPFGQDEPNLKPNSLVAKWSMMNDTLDKAINNEQIQPVLVTRDNHE